MFDLKKMMDAFKDASQMQKKLQDELKSQIVEGSAGGGMVVAKMNGNFELLDLQIENSVFEMNDHAFLKDMTKAAVNDAVSKVRDVMSDKMRDLTSKLGM